jgi:hypothetical protein
MQRPYVSLSIEALEALYAEHIEDVSVLSQLVHELSIRTTRRARRLLALAADSLSKLEPETESAVQPSDKETAAPPVEDGPLSVDADPPSDGGEDSSPQEQPEQAQFFGEQPPDDRKRPERLTRIRPVGTPGLPQPWIRPLSKDKTLAVAADADFPQVYAAALAALIVEIKATGAGQRRYELENGVRAAGNEAVYEFAFTDDAELFQEARVEIEISGRRINGSIVSISSGRLWLSTGEELGSVLKRVVLLVDATALLEALKQKVEEAHKGELSLNRSMADAVAGRGKPPVDPVAIPEAPSERALDSAQSNARKRALTASVTYIWGPPGCGKTQVLSEIVRSAFEADKRILVCSNTNKAVDQVLYRICESLGRQHPAMEGGRIVRVGTIADRKLASAYNDYVTIDGIVERHSADLKARLSQVQAEIAWIGLYPVWMTPT